MNRREFNLNLLCAAGVFALPAPQSLSQLRVNGQRVNDHLRKLSEFGKNPQGGVSRVAYSEADLKGREYAMKLMREANLDVSVDAAGNIVGRRAGNDANLKPLVIGSHIDSVPEGGNYDGDVGSIGAIEVGDTLAENKVALTHTLESITVKNGKVGTH